MWGYVKDRLDVVGLNMVKCVCGFVCWASGC